MPTRFWMPVECRYFAGLSEQETADALALSLRTVQREIADLMIGAFIERLTIAALHIRIGTLLQCPNAPMPQCPNAPIPNATMRQSTIAR
jgi:hypothetical protein